MADNTEIKDGLGNEFTLRTKDISPLQDGTLRRAMTFSTLYPIDYGTGGSFQMAVKSGSMAAGLAAASPILSFWWTSSTLKAVLKRIRFNAWSLGTGFTAGIASFDVFMVRAFNVADTGGSVATMSGNNGKLRTSMATSVVGEIRYSATATLTAGTRTKDAQPMDNWSLGVGTGTNTTFSTTPMNLLQKLQGEHPVVLSQYEGVVVEATVPATGVWTFSATPDWDEVTLF